MNRMVRICLSALLVVAVSATVSACGDDGNTDDLNNDIIGELPIDVATGDTNDVADDAREDVPVGDVPTEVVCACATTDECCDGCNPLKEGQACAMDSVPNCKTPVCQAGACITVDLTCAPDGKCLTENGTCNTETGACEFDLTNALADGTPCAAQDGVDGSGSCLFGVCREFSECDYRAYDQDGGMPCNYDSECISGLCIADGWGWDHFCSQRCETTACPEGLRCTKNDEGDYFCMRIGTENYPGDASIGLFKPCNIDADCAGGLCLGYDTTRFCTMNCEADGGGAKDASKCGDCGECQDGGIDKGFAFEYYCTPDSDGQDGDPCQSPMDCGNHFCYEGYCSNQCFIFGEGLDSCPEGFECVLGAYAEDLQTCVADTSLHKGFGEICAHDYECQAGTCRDVGGKSICVNTCDVCSDGECRQIGWTQTDTTMELWKEGNVEAPVTSDNDGGEGGLSRISYYVEAGSYLLMVKGGDETVTGPYVLSGAYNGGIEMAVEADEVEANDTRETAEVKVLPFLVNAQIEAAGQDWFKFDVAVPEGSTTVGIIAEALQVPEMACVPTTLDGTAAYGDACTWDWQCVDGFQCLEGMCNKVCELDTDCPDGICFAYSETDSRCVPAELIGAKEISDSCSYAWECDENCFADEYLGEYYCTKACTVDGDCPTGMGCLGDICNKGFPEPNFPYGYCRMNADCESYICVDGMCTADCTVDDDCEGSAAIVPDGPMDLCAACATNADCNDGTEEFFDEAYCVQVSEDESFCAPQCTFNEGICPAGTRCFSLDGFTSVCAPVSFTCQAGGVGCHEAAGECVRPFIYDGELCRFDEECYGGKCAQGVCRSETCDGTLECDCELLECVDSYCVFTAASDRILEVEPNNAVDEAQVLLSIPAKVVGGFNTQGMASLDNDIYKLSVTGGNAYTFVVSAACGTDSDPAMLLRTADGEYVDGWAVDDASSTNYFPAMYGYVPETSGFMYVEIVQGPYVDGILRQPYVLDVTTFVPEASDSCEGAIEFVGADFQSGGVNFDHATDSIVPPASLGDMYGPDMARYIEVPGATPGNFSYATVMMGIDPAASNLFMYAVTDCADMDGSLVTWSNFNVVGDREALTLVNDGTEARRFNIVMETASWEHSSVVLYGVEKASDVAIATIGGAWDNPYDLPAVKDVPASMVTDLAFPFPNLVAPTDGACADKDTTGKEIVFKVDVPAGLFLKAEITDAFTSAAIYVVDARTPNLCGAYGSSLVYYMPAPDAVDPDADLPVYIVVEPMGHPGGKFQITASVAEIDDCAGPCDPAVETTSCLDDGKLCQCNATTKFWENVDCAADCVAGGYSTGGECHTFVTGTNAGKSGCMCEYDCAIEGILDSMCYYGSYTNCTCASGDPCGWVGDGYCDEFCTNEYEDHFTEAESDCTPAE